MSENLSLPDGVANDAEALAVVMEADELVEAMALVTVGSKSDLDYAAGELRSIVTRKDAIEATFQRLKKPFDDGIAALREFFDQPIARLQQAEDDLKRQISVFQQHAIAAIEEQKRDHATSRDDKIQTLRDQAVELEIASITSDSVEEAEAKAQAAAEIRDQINEIESLPPPIDIPATAPKAEGISVRANWQGEVTDIDMLWASAIDDVRLRGLFKIDDAAVRALAKVVKSTQQIPGLRFYNKGSVSVRRTRGQEG